MKTTFPSIDFCTHHHFQTIGQIEWPTVFLAAGIYAAWCCLTFFHSYFPIHLLCILGGIVIAMQSSLQHETMHGHPTRFRLFNKLIGYPPISLWLPYEIYQSTHLQHHKNESLTDPYDDPESKYISEQSWQNSSDLTRMMATLNATIFGRLLVGPFLIMGRLWHAELASMIDGDLSHLKIWGVHFLSVALVTAWLAFCKMDLGLYFLLFVLPGTALLSLRSFAEHRADVDPLRRTAIVEDASLLAFFFLNNNLHAVHHRHSSIAWYRLPKMYAENRFSYLNDNNFLVYHGYGEIIRRFLFKRHDVLVHPFTTLTPSSAYQKDSRHRSECHKQLVA